MNEKKTIDLDGENLKIEDVINIAEKGYPVAFKEGIQEIMTELRERLDKQLRERPDIKIYGTNRLHGDLKDMEVPPELLKLYQKKYMKVHNCGTGAALPVEWVRAIMVIRLNSFAKNLSAMRWETCKLMLDMLNRNVTPWVLEEGSVGASGDLVPLAMIGAVLIGLPESKAYYNGELLSAKDAFEKAGLAFTELDAKEAMGLTNGSNFIAAGAVFAIRDAELLLKNASIAAALSVEAVRGERNAFSELINNNRPHPGQLVIAKQMRNLTEGSKRTGQEAQMDFFSNIENAENARIALDTLKKSAIKIPEEHRAEALKRIDAAHRHLDLREREVFNANKEIEALKKYLKDNNVKIEEVDKAIRKLQKTFGELRIQDRYSYRAVPQVHGPAYEAVEKLRDVVNIEINSATDNPLFSFEGQFVEARSGANFHGQPLAAVIDYVKITLTSLGLISDKRSFSLLDRRLSYGLPADLAYDTSKADGGLMIAQYAGAGRAAECRVLAGPSSIMSLSTAANQEDFVSMGSIGVLHLHKIISNVQKIIGIEVLCAFRGIELTKDVLPTPLRPLGKGTAKIYQRLAETLEPIGEDTYLRTDMEKAIELVKTGELAALVSDLLDKE